MWAGYGPLFLAEDIGEYEGARIKLIEMSGVDQIISALRNRQLDGAAMTLDQAALLAKKGLNLRVILVMGYSKGGDALVGSPDITSLEELRGKRIAMANRTANNVIVEDALERVGIPLSDVELVRCEVNNLKGCVVSADAVTTFEPYVHKIRRLGGHILFDSRAIPEQITDVLVVFDDTVEVQPHAVARLLLGYFKAVTYVIDCPADAHRRMARWLQVEVGEMPSILKSVEQARLDWSHDLLDQRTSEMRARTGETAGLFGTDRAPPPPLEMAMSKVGKGIDHLACRNEKR